MKLSPVWTVGQPSLEPESMSSEGPVVLSPGWIVNLPPLTVMGLLLVWAVGLPTLGEVILLLGWAETLRAACRSTPGVGCRPVSRLG